MKRIFHVFCGLLAVILSLTSCLGSSDSDITTYNDVAIKSFSLGKLNRYIHTTTTSGADSVYKSTFTASSYKMNIDQLKHTISNADSLPIGTDKAHIICTVSTVNNGVVYLKSLTSDTLKYFSSGNDSVDFTQPRVFRVFSSDGLGYRDYLVSLNVRSQEAGKFGWEAAEKSNFPQPEDSDEREAAESAGLRYIGATNFEVFAFNSEGVIMKSSDEGETWTEDKFDTDVSQLPQTSIGYVSWFMDYKTDYALLVGNNPSSEKAMVVWRKLVDDDGSGRWVLMTLSDNNPYYLPVCDGVQLVKYDDGVLAFCSNKTIYKSRDQGITWRKYSTIQLPKDYTGMQFKVAADDDGYLWLTDTDSGQTWKGTLSK